MTDLPECKICQGGLEAHLAREEAGEVHHRFSLDGQLIPLREKPKKASSVRPVIQITPAPDLALRSLLQAKGLLTSDDIMTLDKYRVIVTPEAPNADDGHG